METVNNFIGGLFQDLEYSAQPKGSYRNLLNAVRGVDGTPSNEKGTTLVATVKENYEILKLLELDVDVIIFSTDGTNSEIGILDKNDVYTTYINTTVFKFSKENLISAVAKKNYKGERVAYFTDGVQPVRRVNLDNLPTGDIDKRTKIFLDYSLPQIAVLDITETGTLSTGIYQFAARLVTEDYNKTAFSFISNPCPITNDTAGQGTKAYDGAPPQTPANKSITLNVSNIDTTYKYLEIAVLTYVGEENTLKISLLPIQPIQNRATLSYVFATENQLQAEITFNELLQEAAHYETAQHILQKDNTLLLANLKAVEESLNFQSTANTLIGSYTIEEIHSMDTNDATYYGGSKDSIDSGVSSTFFTDYNKELTAHSKVGYMRGEAYSFALVPIFKGRKFGNAYHIPALAKEITGNDATTGDYNFYKELRAHTSSKRLGAKMSSLRYPSGQGYPDSPIRYHLMPTQMQEPITTVTGSIRVLGVEFTEPVFSEEQLKHIEGYVIVRRHRSDEHKTIVAQGIAQPLMKTGENNAYVTVSPVTGKFPYCNSNMVDIKNRAAFYSPETVITEADMSSVSIVDAVATLKGVNYLVADKRAGASGRKDKYSHCFLNYTHVTSDAGGPVNVSAGTVQYVPKDTGGDNYYLGNDNLKYSLKEVNGYLTFKTDNNLPMNVPLLNGRPEYYFEEKSGTDITSHHLNNQLVKDGTIGDTDRYLYNLVVNRPTQYGEIYEGSYMYVGHRLFSSGVKGPIKLYGGDTFIGKFGVVSSTAEINGKEISQPGIQFRTLNYFPCESTINVNYRHYITALDSEDNIGTVPYFPKNNKLWTKDSTGILQLYPTLGHCKGYNRQYSFVNTSRPFFPKGLDDVEVTDFSNRVIYSDTTVEGEKYDAFRSFLANNYHDIPRDKGGITDIFDFRGTLYIHTVESLFRAMFNERTTQATSSGQVVLGNGGLFPLPSKEILTVDGGYAGTQNKYGSVNTPFGRFFVDQKRQTVFLLNEFPEDISSAGLSKFFLENLVYGNLMSAYDKDGKRWILSTPNFTISFSPLLKSWSSFHSYTGKLMLASGDVLYITEKDNSGIYSMNTGEYGKYFNMETKPFHLEFVVNEGVDTSKVFDNMVLYTSSISPSNIVLQHDVFNTMQFFNDVQNTGEVKTVVPKTFAEEFDELAHDQILVKKKGREFRLAIPFDMVIDIEKSMFDVNNLATDTAYKPRLTDKHLVVRCTYDNFANNRFQVNAIKTHFRILSR
jgi:hypothetical protein